MKIRNRIMSWILSPAAYLVWHAMGNLDEWGSPHEGYKIAHQPTGVVFWVANGRWFFDGHGGWSGSIGLFDRHFLWPRAKRVIKHTLSPPPPSRKHKLFIRMTEMGGRPE